MKRNYYNVNTCEIVYPEENEFRIQMIGINNMLRRILRQDVSLNMNSVSFMEIRVAHPFHGIWVIVYVKVRRSLGFSRNICMVYVLQVFDFVDVLFRFYFKPVMLEDSCKLASKS